MPELKSFEGNLVVLDARFCIVLSRFNGFIVDQLLAGAVDALIRHGAENEQIHVVKTPGAYELPLAVQRVAAKKQ